MSSDSEDLDEDELLQIALKEQAEHDRNYQRPPSRPVVNLVQPPSSSKNQMRNAAPQQRAAPPAKPRRSAKEEEDSDVELLSISSEDDDSAVGLPTGRQGARKGAKEEMGERGWDGGKPAAWKHVDEKLEYFETILHAYITPEARDALKSLHELLLEKASESMNESLETPVQGRRAIRSEDAFEDRQQGAAISPDDLISLAQQNSAELLAGELERTRLNIACFMESSTLPRDSVPENAKAAYSTFKAPLDSPKKAQRAVQQVGSPVAGRWRRRGF